MEARERKVPDLASKKGEPESSMHDKRPGADRATPTACPHGVAPAVCLACRPHLERLGRALLEGHEDEWSCAQFQAVVAARGGNLSEIGAPSSDDAHLLAHVARCEVCAADLAVARGALAGLLDPGAALPPGLPEFDLSFLRPASPLAPRFGPRRLMVGLALGALALLLTWLGLDGRAGSGPGGGPATRLTSLASPRARQEADSTAHGPAAAPLVVTEGPGSGPTALPPAPATRAAPRPARSPAAAVVAARPALASPESAPIPSATSAAQAPEEEEPDEPAEPPIPTATAAPAMAYVSCALHAFGPQAGLFAGRCGPYRSAAAYDLYRVTVSQAGRWTFDTCEDGGGLDTVLTLYPAGGFDPATPCQGILAFDDNGCGGLSRLTVDLAPGVYLLLVSEQSGDLSDHYRLGVEAPAGNDACPRVADGPSTAVPVSPSPTVQPSPTAGAEVVQPPEATAEPQPGVSTPVAPTATAMSLP